MKIYKPQQRRRTFRLLEPKELEAQTNRHHPDCVFHKIIGQEQAVESLLDFIHLALKDTYHEVKGQSAILLHGGKSNGKTTFARLIAKALSRPLLETDPNMIKATDDIFELAVGTAAEAGLPMEPLGQMNGKPYYAFPNIIIFIDEIHGLKKAVMTGLLKALESKDRLLTLRDGYVDCSHVLWIGATTERGDLFDAFESRFAKVRLVSYTEDEVARIIKINFPHWSDKECQRLAVRSGLIVREALEIAAAVEANASRHRIDRLTSLENVSRQRGIDEDGLTQQQLAVLEALAKSPGGLNYEQLGRVAQCKVQELKNHVLPALLVDTSNRPARIVWTGKNSYITEAGMEDLNRRKVTHES